MLRPIASIFFALSLSACSLGLTVPEMQELNQVRAEEKFDEIDLAAQIQCEIHKGVQDALQAFIIKGPLGGSSIEWIRDWQAKVTMKITVDEKAGLSPGVTFSQPFHNSISYFIAGGRVTTPQSFSSTIGLQASSDATRIETIGFTYDFNDFVGTQKKPKYDADLVCDHRRSILIESNLKIGDFILNKVSVANDPKIVTSKDLKGKSPYTAFSDEITFVVVYGGNFTPVWKLVEVTGSATNPFFNATRTRTHDVTIAMGPKDSPEVAAVHNAQLIGQAVATAIQSQQNLGQQTSGYLR